MATMTCLHLSFVQDQLICFESSVKLLVNTIEYKMEEKRKRSLRKRETIVSSTEFYQYQLTILIYFDQPFIVRPKRTFSLLNK